MRYFTLIVAAFLAVGGSPAAGQPTISIEMGGLNGNNRVWELFVYPDVDTFIPNTSLAVEIDLQFSRNFGLHNATLNDTFWNVPPVSNPGNNPFTGTQTEGVWQDTNAAQIFIAAGSELFETADPILLATIETTGPGGGTFSWGGRTLLAGTAHEYTSSRIAQNAINYNGLTGSFGDGPPGDFSGNGAVLNEDLTALLNHWGDETPLVSFIWQGTPPNPPAVNNSDLTALLNNWGKNFGDGGGSLAATTVPEPAGAALAIILATGLAGFARPRRRQEDVG